MCIEDISPLLDNFFLIKHTKANPFLYQYNRIQYASIYS